jgi:hypothetical protein
VIRKQQGLQANATAHMMAPSKRTRTRWHKAHAPRASAAATSVRESRNTASRRARLSKPASAIARCSGEARNGWLRRAEETLLLPLPCSPSSSRSTGCHRHLWKDEADSRNAGRVGHEAEQGQRSSSSWCERENCSQRHFDRRRSQTFISGSLSASPGPGQPHTVNLAD